jgi:hypothetical protein
MANETATWDLTSREGQQARIDLVNAAADGAVRFPAHYRSLDVLRDVYLGKVMPPVWQIKAAVAALKFEFPALAVVGNVSAGDFGDRLDQARLRSQAVQDTRAAGGSVVEFIREQPVEAAPVSEAPVRRA